MSVTTIQIPGTLVGAIRTSLLAACGEIDEELSRGGFAGAGAAMRTDPATRLAELEGLLEQVGGRGSAHAEPHELTGPDDVIWNVLYETVCVAAEAIAEDLTDYWQGEIDPSTVRARIADLGARFDLLDSLGAAPRGSGARR